MTRYWAVPTDGLMIWAYAADNTVRIQIFDAADNLRYEEILR